MDESWHGGLFSNLQSSLLRCGTGPNEWGAQRDGWLFNVQQRSLVKKKNLKKS